MNVDQTPLRFDRLLRLRRQQVGLTQQALADLATLSVRAVRDLETGRVERPRSETVSLLADALRLTGRGRSAFEAAARLSRPPADESLAPPTRRSAIIGRKPEVDGLVDAFTEYGDRLVSVVGLGGVGKTRLAQEVAWLMQVSAGWAVFWVGDDGRQLSSGATLDSLVRRAGILDRLTARIGRLPALLVLDGMDYGVPAGLLDEMLCRCPELRILITARTRWETSDERVIPLGPLDVPNVTQDRKLSRLGEIGGVRFLESRLRYLRPGFQPGPDELPKLAGLCRSLDGLPSALLAAADWALVQSAGQLLDQMSGQAGWPPGWEFGEVRVVLLEALASLTARQSALLGLLVEEAREWSLSEVVSLSPRSPEECLVTVRELHLRGLIRVLADQDTVRFAVLNLVRSVYREEGRRPLRRAADDSPQARRETLCLVEETMPRQDYRVSREEEKVAAYRMVASS